MLFFNSQDNLLSIIFLNIRTTFFRLYEWLHVVWLYYPRRSLFLGIDVLFALQYFWKNPHRISKEFQLKRGAKNIYTYGETPLTTLDKIAKECRILSKDIVFELGCGSGRSCFWLATFIGCKVVGIDYLPTFMQKAKWIQKKVVLPLELIEDDMFTTSLEDATVLYLYGTCLEDEEIEKLVVNFRHLKQKTRIITVSYPLTEYCREGEYRVLKQFSGRFPWGVAEIFLNEKVT